ncbi:MULTISPECIES: 50S ribosomal protein L25/general stress protein Ctc [Butyricimonas]|uniref:50S ribosomal protein L25/general stress protein Ctc n=1 Tax=Butyricimonas TaxID=574697 RepID=UPI000C08B516|nr:MULTISPECIES: 50S ribosomal protein L25/general stress protein Ctc [Butyricimonas]MCB6973314.1 50S ribosomal protein L25/general stress protein Ctc [Butyricimonas synergistica]MCG4520215.1 50S ribosomal protein L25/general stress protein Ctc [Butyricimonas sp. DFI.6.44]
MQVFELKGEVRNDLGKKATKAVRNEEKVPCVLYGGEANVHFAVRDRDLKKLLYTPNVYLVKLVLEGKTYDAVMRDIQFHPVTDKVLHIDFYQTFEDKPVVIEVPVKTTGHAAGVQAGGKLVLITRKLKVKALPKDMPDEITLDVTSLGVGKSIKVQDINIEGIDIVNAKSVVVAQVKLTRAARAAQNAQ